MFSRMYQAKKVKVILLYMAIAIFSLQPVFSNSSTLHCPPCIIDMTASIVKKTPEGKFVGGWDPKRIEVNEGDQITLKIRSLDVTHIMYIIGYNIESPEIQPGKVTEVHFTADKPGLFYYTCHMECGPFHQKMVGQLIVNPKPKT